jgi:hypothetical protein
MGSIVSQAGQKCYGLREKSSRGVSIRGILPFPELRAPRFRYDRAIPAPTRVARSELNSTQGRHSFAE